jgi:hypothetical protein
MPFVNPYEALLEGRDARDVMAGSVDELSALVRDWPEARFEASYAPGKWTARQILLHLAHVEMIDGVRNASLPTSAISGASSRFPAASSARPARG